MTNVGLAMTSLKRPTLVGVALLIASAHPLTAEEGWAAAVHARYALRYNGINVGRLDFNSKTGKQGYSVSGSGEISILFGAIKWAGSSSVTGAVQGGVPVPQSYAFDWHKNKKGGTVKLGFTGAKATSVAVDPPSGDHPDTVPLKPEHMNGVLDPLSAVMMLTKADNRAPCDRRVNIFDGKQRYDIVFSLKRHTRIAPSDAGGASVIGFVCRAVYEPIAGHRNNAASQAYAANRDVEVVMRPIPGTKLLIPSSVTIPTPWGTGSMTTERIEITAGGAQIALTE